MSSLQQEPLALLFHYNRGVFGYKLLLEPKASSAIVFTASVLAFLFSLAIPTWPLAVVTMEAIGWSGLAHLASTSNYSGINNTGDDALTFCAEVEEEYEHVVAELRSLFRHGSGTAIPQSIGF